MEERKEDALSEDLDPSREGERPRKDYPNPTQERIDDQLKKRKGWETEDSPHEGEEGTEIT
jgi:hypothetical protein